METFWILSLKLLAVVALVVANGFFVAVEFALVSVRRARIDHLASQGHVQASLVRRLFDQTDKVLAAAQLGITMSSLALGWIGETTLVAIIRPWFDFLGGAAGATSHVMATVIAFALITALHIVLGEQAPKIFAIRHPERISFLTVRPILIFERVFRPFIWLLDHSSQLALRIFGIQREFFEPGRLRSLEDLKHQFVEVHRRGLLGHREHQMLHRVVELAERQVKELMTPRPEVMSLEENQTLSELLKVFQEASHTCYPVYRERPENIIGYVTISDVLKALSQDLQAPAKPIKSLGLVHPILYVPESKTALTLLSQTQKEGIPIVAVLNEYGDAVGIVTLNGLAEEIVGGLGEELAKPLFERVDPHTLRVDGHLRLADANEALGLRIPEHDEYQTIAGFIFYQLKHVPQPGEMLQFGSFRLIVEQMKGPKIEKVLIQMT